MVSAASNTTKNERPRRTRCSESRSSVTTRGCANSRRSNECTAARPQRQRLSHPISTTIIITTRITPATTITITAITADTWVARGLPAPPPPASSLIFHTVRIPKWKSDCALIEADSSYSITN